MKPIHDIVSTLTWREGMEVYSIKAKEDSAVVRVAFVMAALASTGKFKGTEGKFISESRRDSTFFTKMKIEYFTTVLDLAGYKVTLTIDDLAEYFLKPFNYDVPSLYTLDDDFIAVEDKVFKAYYNSATEWNEEVWFIANNGDVIALEEDANGNWRFYNGIVGNLVNDDVVKEHESLINSLIKHWSR